MTLAKRTPKPKTKTCSQCRRRKAASKFPRDKNTKSGLSSWCTECHRKNSTRFRKEHPDKKHDSNRRNILKREYGITPEDYDRMFKRQGGVCAICGTPPKKGGRRLNVDHDHKTKKVRGLLCFLCNRGLGIFRDKPDRLEKAAAYLRK